MEYSTNIENTYNTNTGFMGALMYNSEFQTEQSIYGGMKIVFEFPTESKEDAQIKREVNSIMMSALHEQLWRKTS